MKKLNLLLFIVLFGLNALSQIKTCTYEKYGLLSESTHNYAIPIDNKLIISRDKNNLFTIKIHDSDLTKAPLFTLSKLHLNSYDEFAERYIYIGDANREGVANGKCIIISIYKLDSYLGDIGKNDDNYLRWDKRLSFTILLKNLRFKRNTYEGEIEEYLDDIFFTIFPLKNKIKTTINPNFDIKNIPDKEKREVLEVPHLNKEKEQEQNKINNIEGIKKILSEVNIEEKVSQIKIEIEEHYKSILKDKMINISARDMVGLRNLSKTLSLTGEFILYVNQNKDIEMIKKVTNCVDDGYSFSISDDKSNFFNRAALSLKDKCTDEYKINGHTYYKLNNDIFTDDYKIDKKITLEIKILRVNLKKGKFKYYTNGYRVPEIVENWCTSNITTNGSYFINTIIIDGELTCNILNLDYETRVFLSGYLKQYSK